MDEVTGLVNEYYEVYELWGLVAGMVAHAEELTWMQGRRSPMDSWERIAGLV